MSDKCILSVDLNAIGSRIRESRTNKNLSQADLAEQTELSMSHISDIENGKVNFSVDTLKKLSSALACSADYILTGTDYYNAEWNTLNIDCTPDEQAAILSVATEFKASMRRNLPKS